MTYTRQGAFSRAYTKPYTRQNAFNRAYLGLRDQGFRQAMGMSSVPSWGCVLLDDVGRRCALGHLLDKPTLNAISSAESVALITSDWPFYAQLRSTHDSGYCPAMMETLLHDMAAKFNLEIPR